MASDQTAKVTINAEDKTGAAFKSASTNVGNFSKKASLANKDVTGLAKTLLGASVAATGLAVAFGVSAVKAFNETETAMTRMAHILREGTVKATEEQVKALQDQAEALERVGVVGKEAILVGQGQLASFDLQVESIEKLIPSILNYAVAEKGLSMTSEELQAVTNGLAQALNGNFTSLTRTGFVLDDATRAMIENGTETERVAALVSVLDSTYLGLNESMRQTTEGQIVGMKFAMNDLKETIGESLSTAITPFITELTAWASRPDVQMKIKEISVVLGEFATEFIPIAIEALKIMFTMVMNLVNSLIELGDIILGTIEKFNRMREAANRASEAHAAAIRGAATKAVNFITAPFRAEGGPVSGGRPYVVGERGPELFVPGSSGSIVPNGAMGGAITINISGNTLLDSTAGEKIGKQIMEVLKNNIRI